MRVSDNAGTPANLPSSDVGEESFTHAINVASRPGSVIEPLPAMPHPGIGTGLGSPETLPHVGTGIPESPAVVSPIGGSRPLPPLPETVPLTSHPGGITPGGHGPVVSPETPRPLTPHSPPSGTSPVGGSVPATGAHTGNSAVDTTLDGAENAYMNSVKASMSGLSTDVGALKNSPTAKAQLATLEQQISTAGKPPSADDLKNIQDSLSKLQVTIKGDKDLTNADVTRISQQVGMVAQGLAGAAGISQIVFQGIGDNNALNPNQAA